MQNIVKTFANKSSTDLSAYAGYAVKFDTDGINICSGITDQPIGVILRAGSTACDVCIFGEIDAIAAGTILAGQMVTPAAAGTITASAGAACQEFGFATMGAVAGDHFNMFVTGSAKRWS